LEPEDTVIETEEEKFAEIPGVTNTFIIEATDGYFKTGMLPIFSEWAYKKRKNGMQLYLFDSEEYNMLIPEYRNFVNKYTKIE